MRNLIRSAYRLAVRAERLGQPHIAEEARALARWMARLAREGDDDAQ